MSTRFALLLGLSFLAAAQDPIAPHSAFEPPAAKAAGSLAASTKASPPDLITTGEKTDFTKTAPYAEAVEISHRLERASRYVKVLDAGLTPEGRTMIALVVSEDREGHRDDPKRHPCRRDRRQRPRADAGAGHDGGETLRLLARPRDFSHHS